MANTKPQIRSITRRLALLSAARRCFAEQGYAATSMRDIAQKADCSLGLFYKYFPDKSSLALCIYEALAATLETQAAAGLAPGKIGERFVRVMNLKLDLLDAERDVLLGLLPVALDPERREGVMSSDTAWIRVLVSSTFRRVVAGAKNAPKPDDQDRVTGMLYALHLLLVLLWSQDRTEHGKATRAAVSLAGEFLDRATWLRALPGTKKLQARVDTVLSAIYRDAGPSPDADVVQQIVQSLVQRHRALPGVLPDAESVRVRVAYFVKRQEPVHFVLPAFPAKSPNHEKVLGTLPDLAEVVALQSLSDLCHEIESVYPPGAELTICSDGHVFADVVGVPDTDVAAYRVAMRRLLKPKSHRGLRLFDLCDVYGDVDAAEARGRLLESYAEPSEAIESAVKKSEPMKKMFNGIHRFMSEDGFVRHPNLSKNAVKKRCKQDAIEVMRRSRAWDGLLRVTFPRAVRLSIHPQAAGTEKFGVHLIPTTDAWLTPWHGVAVLKDGVFCLMHRHAAEALGAKVVYADGQPSHMELG